MSMSDLFNGRVRWIVFAFLGSGLLMSALLTWQLYETAPARWCVIAKSGTPDLATACITVLMKLLEIKGNVVIGLLVIVGLSVLSLAVVALGVRIGASGPGGLTANIGADKTTVTDGNSVVEMPTPPSN